MNVQEAIRLRRSTKLFKDIEPISHTDVEDIIEAATHAPTHHFTEAWRFIVMEGDSRMPFYNACLSFVEDKYKNVASDEIEKRREKMISKALFAPTAIAVIYSENKENPRGDYKEDILSIGAAIQNMLLEATAKDIQSIWKTGGVYNSAPVREVFKLEGDEEVIGVIFLGKAALGKIPKRIRTDAEDKTIWI
ncbi:nitroreductase [Phocicoccus pinnipedialis]|uniref:NAD(P)H nitroreductase YdjA n=1 Tax=Phocicoccus pinnipedialis TaxID=110845 RepID=A0A6V7R8P0_9BACL|nr:nitroreductase [Jeotgalicoccus pinnipedialis]MBP1940164.1 nitroreductase [Jeotgalicoccus pinnipedialis]CAD2073809.1 Putative NAD(P)H nitroreductase YdjA [Jeotgalicoccus pinnipedialis]